MFSDNHKAPLDRRKKVPELQGRPRRPRRQVLAKISGETRTKQAQKDACDINLIVKAATAGHLVPGNSGKPTYGDFTSGMDYHAALNHVLLADDNFNDLPSAVRKHCDNDPGAFLDMAFDPERTEEMIELGLLPPETTRPKPPGDPTPEPSEPGPGTTPPE